MIETQSVWYNSELPCSVQVAVVVDCIFSVFLLSKEQPNQVAINPIY